MMTSLLFRTPAEDQSLGIPAVDVFFEVARFIGLFTGCNRLAFGLKMLGKASFKLFPQATVIYEAKEFGTVHGVKAVEQRALEQIFVLHDVPRCGCCLHSQHSLEIEHPRSSSDYSHFHL
jgi:hypothetical protein